MSASEFRELSALKSVDAEYRFGRPKVYLRDVEIARLTLVRSRLGDTRAERAAESLPLSPLARPDVAVRSVPSSAASGRRAITSRGRSTLPSQGGR